MIVLSFPLPAKPLNLNQQLHWAAKAKIVKAWRHAAQIAARDAINRREITRNQPFSVVRLSLPVRSLNVRRDPTNWQPTCKAAIDGLVAAELFVDDDRHHIAECPPLFHDQKLDPKVSILIRPAADGVL